MTTQQGATASAAHRTLSVQVPGWVIDDGSFPRASVGDVVAVLLEFYESDGVGSPCEQVLTAIARPAYGRAPQQYRDGALRWFHVLYGDGWSAGWWSTTPQHGPVRLRGTVSAGLGLAMDEDPIRIRGRVRRVQLIEERLERIDNGWRQEAGTEQLSDTDVVPGGYFGAVVPAEVATYVAPTGVLVDLDLDDIPNLPAQFAPGSLSVVDQTVWVIDHSDPILFRIDTSARPERVTEYRLPVAIEPPSDEWARWVHADASGCWVVGNNDIHRCAWSADGSLTVERYCTEGGRSIVYEGRLYLVRGSRDAMYDHRRFGIMRRWADPVSVRVLDEDTRHLVPITDDRLVRTVVDAGRGDRRRGYVGGRWWVYRGAVVHGEPGSQVAVDISSRTTGAVRWITSDAWSDPANAEVVAAITVDASTFRRVDPGSDKADET